MSTPGKRTAQRLALDMAIAWQREVAEHGQTSPQAEHLRTQTLGALAMYRHVYVAPGTLTDLLDLYRRSALEELTGVASTIRSALPRPTPEVTLAEHDTDATQRFDAIERDLGEMRRDLGEMASMLVEIKAVQAQSLARILGELSDLNDPARGA